VEKLRSSTQHHISRILGSCLLLVGLAKADGATEPLRISDADALRIGKRIWQNESNGTVAGLTAWNAGENFASLGIGHFIWYPEGVRGPFEESFPKFLTFAREHHAAIPAWLNQSSSCPWNSRAEFSSAQNSSQMRELRQFLSRTIDVQAQFMVARLQQSLAKMLVNRHYASDRDLILALADVFNAELKEVAAAGCRVIQVEEPQHHIAGANGTATDKDLEFFTEAVNREIAGVETEIWLHTCWGNPNQQPLHWERPSYERSLPYLLQTNADVITLECASTNGRDLPLLARFRTDKKIAIGVVNHSTAAVEPPEFVAGLIRSALEYVPPERLVLSTDCGFGREGLARRIAFYKCVAINLGANIVRRELKLPEVEIPAADPRWTFAG